MKKALLLVSILSISVFSTACINNFAVQELNNKAKAYMEQGDYQGAIERLKSSIDLDDSVFESHYNLAVAYTNAEDYVNAISAFKKAIELKPDFADGYYSLAVAEESLVTAINADEVEVNADGQFVKPAQEDELEPVAAEEENISDVKTLSVYPGTAGSDAAWGKWKTGADPNRNECNRQRQPGNHSSVSNRYI